MNADDLTPVQREEVQMQYLNAWLARKDRERFEADLAATKARAKEAAYRRSLRTRHRKRKDPVVEDWYGS